VSPGLNRYLRGVAYARNQLHRISGSSLGPHEFLHEVSRLIRTVVPHAAPAWTTIDPESLLPTGALKSEKSPDLVRALWRNELLDDDVNGIADLLPLATPVAALSELHPATLAASPRVQLIHRPAGIGDELRVLLRADGLVWGKGALYRAADDRVFAAEERAFVGGIAPLITAALRHRLARRPPEGDGLLTPGVVIVDHADRLTWTTLEGTRLMALIPGEPATTVLAVAAQARVREQASARVRLADGRWLLVQAASMHEAIGTTSQIAVTLMPAPRSTMLPIILALHALSPREREVAQLLQLGLRTDEIAAHLHISPHTLRDHIKSIFHKLGVSHRAELMALVARYVTPDGRLRH